REHALGCADCREYLAQLRDVEQALAAWEDEAPLPLWRERIPERAALSPQHGPPPRPASSALPLLGLLPVMVVVVLSGRALAAWLPLLGFWPSLEGWPVLQATLAPAAALVALVMLGGLAALAMAPALVLESEERRRLWSE